MSSHIAHLLLIVSGKIFPSKEIQIHPKISGPLLLPPPVFRSGSLVTTQSWWALCSMFTLRATNRKATIKDFPSRFWQSRKLVVGMVLLNLCQFIFISSIVSPTTILEVVNLCRLWKFNPNFAPPISGVTVNGHFSRYDFIRFSRHDFISAVKS